MGSAFQDAVWEISSLLAVRIVASMWHGQFAMTGAVAKIEAIPARWPVLELNSGSTQTCGDGCEGRRLLNGQSAIVQAGR